MLMGNLDNRKYALPNPVGSRPSGLQQAGHTSRVHRDLSCRPLDCPRHPRVDSLECRGFPPRPFPHTFLRADTKVFRNLQRVKHDNAPGEATMGNLRRFLALPWARQRALASAYAQMLRAVIDARLFPAKTTIRLMAPDQADASGADPQDVDFVVWAVRRAARRVPKGNCLPQALVARRMLAKRGLGCQTFVGALLEPDGSLLAHAWLERDGEVILGDLPDLNRFTPLRRDP